jgi:TPR repeat protein
LVETSKTSRRGTQNTERLKEKLQLMDEVNLFQQKKAKIKIETLEKLKFLAKSEDDLKILLAIVYEDGLGEYEQNSHETYREAIKWLEAAAANGSTDAMGVLSTYYFNGQGVPKDYVKAIHYLEEAAERGNKKAARHLITRRAARGEIIDCADKIFECLDEKEKLYYEVKTAQQRNEKIKIETLEKLKILAADDDDLKITLSNIYYNGLGEYSPVSPETYQEAIKWLEAAAANGRTDAMNNLVFLLQKKNAKVKSEILEKMKLIAIDNDDLKILISKVYGSGLGEFDPESQETYREEVKWLEAAAEKDNAFAMRRLGINYFHGWGVDKDVALADYYFEEAAKRGDKEAAAKLIFRRAAKGEVELNTQQMLMFMGTINAEYIDNVKELSEKEKLNCKVVMAQQKKEKVSIETLERMKELALEDDDLKVNLFKIYSRGAGEYDANSHETHQEARKWLERAAKNGRVEAIRILGVYYTTGLGGTKDDALASYYLEEVAKKGDKEAAIALIKFKIEKGEIIDYTDKVFEYLDDKEKMYCEFNIARLRKEKIRVETLERMKELALEDDDLKNLLFLIYNDGLGEYSPNSQETYQEAIKWLEAAAAKGHSYAITNLGVYHVKGLGVPKNDARAVYYFEEAMKKGDQQASRYLASLKASREEKLGPVKDFNESEQLIYEVTLAHTKHDKVDPRSLERLKVLAIEDDDLKTLIASVYDAGLGEYEPNSNETYRESVRWLEAAAENGDAVAMRRLGVHYFHGEGVIQDEDKATYYSQKAARRGNKRAAQDLTLRKVARGEVLDSVEDLTEIERLIYEAAEAGRKQEKIKAKTLERMKELALEDDDLKLVLSQAYNDGFGEYNPGSQETYLDSAKWLKAAIAKGRSDAMRRLGVYYYNGQGVIADQALAIRYFKEAARRGDKDAARDLKIVRAGIEGNLDSIEELSEKERLFYKTEFAQKQNEKIKLEALERMKELALEDDDLKMLLVKIYNIGLGEYKPRSQETLREIVRWLEAAAENGRTQAMGYLVRCYLEGVGVKKDEVRAGKYLKKIINQHPVDLMGLANQSLHEVINRGDAYETHKFVSKLLGSYALVQDLDREISITFMELEEYKVFPELIEKLRKYSYEESSERQKQAAFFVLGNIYDLGQGEFRKGSPQTNKEAIILYEISASYGSWLAKCRLGEIYAEGIVASQDYAKSIGYYQQALSGMDTLGLIALSADKTEEVVNSLNTIIRQIVREKEIQDRQEKIVVVGAGLSGVLSAIQIANLKDNDGYPLYRGVFNELCQKPNLA